MKLILLALQFLTRLPIKVGEVGKSDPARSMLWFPVVGLFLGGILVLITFEAGLFHLPATITAALLILTLVIITGGLHLDGLSDMCDGFYAGKSREEIISIMRDSHTGAMGVVGIVVVLLLKYNILLALLGSVPIKEQYISLVVSPMVSRWGMVMAAALAPYAAEEGTARPFVAYLRPKYWLIATFITYALAIGLLSLAGLGLCLVGLVVVVLSVIYIRQRIGGVTGDTLGAINEILEVAILFTAYLIYRQ